jgi:putative PIN family toxin of toxin-antitoxin system
MRWVLDTDVMVAAIRSDSGASRVLLNGALLGRFTLLASTSLLIEYEAVMTRESHLAASGLKEDDVGALLDAVTAVANPVRLAFHWRPQVRDADDDMVLETAVNGGADALVTFNIRHFAEATERFGIKTLKPGHAVRFLEERS